MEQRKLGIQKLFAFTAVYILNFVGYLGLKQGLPFWYLSQTKPFWAIPYYSFGLVTILLCAPIAWAAIQVIQTENRRPLFIFVGLQMLGWCIWEWGLFAFHNFFVVAFGVFICLAASFALFAVYRKQSMTIAIALQSGVLWSIYGLVLAIMLAHLNNHP